MTNILPGGRRMMFLSTVAGQLFALLRNILVARLLGPHEFGIAAVVILTISFLDSLGNAGPQNLLIQAKSDDQAPLLAAAHSVTIGRGVSTTVLLIALAAPLSAFFGLQLSWPAIIGLAISAMIAGFLHQGIRVVQREGDFRAEAISQLLGELAALVVAVIAAYLTRSYIAIVVGLIARSLVITAVSHLLARQPYNLSGDRANLRRFWAFGWPLLINGPLLFFAAQADRLFISRELGVAALGAYSAATVLIASPSNAIMRWMGTNFTPALAKFYHDNNGLPTRSVVYDFIAALFIVGFLMFIGFAVFGGGIIDLLYGAKYRMAPFIVALIALLQSLRFLRAWSSVLSLSIAASGGILLSTVVRSVFLLGAYVGLAVIGGLEGLLIGLIAGEFLAFVVGQVILNHNAGRRRMAGTLAAGTFCVIAAAIILALRETAGHFFLQAFLFCVATPLGCGALLLTVSQTETVARARSLLAKRRPLR